MSQTDRALASRDITKAEMQVLKRFADTIRYQTVSSSEGFSLEPFHSMRDYARAAWPLVFSTMRMELHGEASILLIWDGCSRDLTDSPIMLTAHQDVVPAGGACWSYPPFQGIVSGGRIYGRGTVDYKCGFAGMLEACNQLIQQGFSPSRTVLLSFGHDEEIGGLAGAGAITASLAERGVRCSSVLDEGGYIYVDSSGSEKAVIATAENGYATFRLQASAVQCHASVPTERTAIGALCRAVTVLEDTWKNLNTADRETTLAPTVISGGCKENVLPENASILVNTRPSPATSVNSVQQTITEIVKPFGVSVELLDNPSVSEPSQVSSLETPDGKCLLTAVQETLGSDLTVEMGVFPAATDSRRYRSIADNIYRFLPVKLDSRGIGVLHSVDESISFSDYLNCVDFYGGYISKASKS